jgi:hypothetical protein
MKLLQTGLLAMMGLMTTLSDPGGAQPADAPTLPPWSSPNADAWANASRATLFTDISQYVPADARSAQMKRRRWKTIPYELKDGTKGTMVWASPDTGAPPVRIPLKVHGRHAIFVGLFSGVECSSLAWIKLDRDPAPVPRQNTNTDYYGNLQDTLFKVAELKEDDVLQIAQQSTGYRSGCGVAYVRLIPLTEQEVAGLKADRSNRSNRRMTVTCDGFSFIYYRRPVTVESLLSEVEDMRDTDVETLILHAPGGDKVAFPSQYGQMPGQAMDDYLVAGHRYFAEAVRELARKKINPVKVIIDGAHAAGLKVQVAVRPAGWSFVEPFTDFWETSFYKEHPQWRCEDRDGTPVTRMSWAVPEVRQHVLGLLREMVQMGADGTQIVFNRGLPVVLYEEPFRELFRKQYGEDARRFDDTEPRIAKLRADIVTTFMREMRQMLDEEQKRRGDGKRLRISAMLLGNEFDNAWYGIDVRRLVVEGLLDEVDLYPFDFGARKGGFDLKFFHDVCAPKGIPVRAAVAYDLKTMTEMAVSHYDAGADGIAVWDAAGSDIRSWSVVSRYGHIDEVKERLKVGLPAQKYYFFHRLGNNVMDGRFPPIWGG